MIQKVYFGTNSRYTVIVTKRVPLAKGKTPVSVVCSHQMCTFTIHFAAQTPIDSVGRGVCLRALLCGRVSRLARSSERKHVPKLSKMLNVLSR